MVAARFLTMKQCSALQRSVEHLLFEEVITPMAIVSHDSRMLCVNRAFCRFLGYSRSELSNMTVKDITHPEDWARCARIIQGGVTRPESDGGREQRYLHKGGRVVWGEVNILTVLNHPRLGKLSVVQILDITSRKAAEASRLHSDARYRILYDNMRDGFGSVSMDGRFLDANQHLLEMLGYTLDEFTSLTYHDLTPEKWRVMEAAIVKEQVLTRGYLTIVM